MKQTQEIIKTHYENNINFHYIEGFGVREVASKVWAIDEFGVAWCYLIEGRDRALLLDTGVGFGCLKKVVQTLTDKPFIVVNTHFHYDHAGGDLGFNEIYVHKNAVEDILKNNTPEYRRKMFRRQQSRSEYSVCPTAEEDVKKEGTFRLIPIEEGVIFDLGDKKLEVIHTPGHTNGDICLLDRYNRHVFSGDAIVSTPTLLYKSYSETVETYSYSIQKLCALKSQFDLIFPGHYITPIGSVYLDDMAVLLQDIMEHPNRSYPLDVDSKEGEYGCMLQYGHASVVFRPNHIFNMANEHTI
ncbi:MAG: MBL fold metallo-hydrolase [bacterium]|nr:MBL fold metallo-hydrolase [bacterium]